MKFIRNIVAAPRTKPVYLFRILDIDGRQIFSDTISMHEILGKISEVIPASVQSLSTVHNQLATNGFYLRGGFDAFGLLCIVVVTPLPK